MPETIKVKLPDGSEKQVPRGTSALDVAREISPRLADAALVARVRPLNNGDGQRPYASSSEPQAHPGGQLVDLAKPIENVILSWGGESPEFPL